eukprot:scaffold28592_cov30-Tisochrysis_lutea.AAC.1
MCSGPPSASSPLGSSRLPSTRVPKRAETSAAIRETDLSFSRRRSAASARPSMYGTYRRPGTGSRARSAPSAVPSSCSSHMQPPIDGEKGGVQRGGRVGVGGRERVLSPAWRVCKAPRRERRGTSGKDRGRGKDHARTGGRWG